MNYFFAIIFVVLFLAVLNFILPHLIKIYWKEKYFNKTKSSGKIFLTFDDGPEISSTSKILDILKRYDIKATFFVIGKNALKNKDTIERIIKEGHTIGIHGSNHLHPWKVFPWQAMNDLAESNRILKSLGVNVRYIRPPFGKLNLFSFVYISINRLKFIHWNADTRDYEKKEPEELKQLLVEKVTSGKVVLLHDGRRPGTSPSGVTIQGLELFLKNTSFHSGNFAALTAAL